MTTSTNLSRLTLATAPDSWGVWFPQDPHQVGWQQYLDEVAAAGYLEPSSGRRASSRRTRRGCATSSRRGA